MLELTTYQIISLMLSLVGVPSLTAVVGWIHNKQVTLEKEKQCQEKSQREEIENLKLGMQALLRSDMISNYNKWSEKGYAPIYARDAFENCWNRYEMLGENGVMEDIRNKFMALPTSK